ncbi:MAG: hypothetical protein ACKO96_14540 [Flammeovirgaceae bacterium]
MLSNLQVLLNNAQALDGNVAAFGDAVWPTCGHLATLVPCS